MTDEHAIDCVLFCSESIYVECHCGEKFYAASEREARGKHYSHSHRDS